MALKAPGHALYGNMNRTVISEEDETKKYIRDADVVHEGTRVQKAEARAAQAETRTEQARTRTEMAETRTEQAESRTESAKTRAEQAETRTEQAEIRTEQAETALQHAVNKESPAQTMAEPNSQISGLTERQREILQLVVEGQNTKEIAGILNISPKTVEYHRLKLMDSLKNHDVSGLVRFAVRVGLLPEEMLVRLAD
jgi:DNA-binding CsgD family transcriptional regulator